MEDRLILTDLYDRAIGEEGKLETHKKGLLHRAFSVFLFRGSEMLIQKRASNKYHSAGLWANTCCSHPRVGEKLEGAVKRRLKEEAGVECPVWEITSFIYRAAFENGLTEYEIDHVFIGEYDGEFFCNYDEAEEMCYVALEFLERELVEYPEKYAAWFLTAAPMAICAYKAFKGGF